MFRRVPSSEIVAAARVYERVPFRHQGRSKSGIDCLGLLAVTFRDRGMTVRDRTDYGRHPNLGELRAGLDERLIRVPRSTGFRAGLVALFRDPLWLHVGLLTGPKSFIHSRGPEDFGPGVVEHILDAQSWAPRLLRLWRHPEMEWDL